jgi:hypothetical protein
MAAERTPTSTPSIPITTHLLAIYNELRRPIFSGSTIYSVRAAFDRAIGDPTFHQPHAHLSDNNNTTTTTRDNITGKSSPLLWKLYILYELSQYQTQRAKQVFYRAIQACPWSKGLVMLAFTHFNADENRLSHPSTIKTTHQNQKDKQGKERKALLEGITNGNSDNGKNKGMMSFDELRRVYEDSLIDKELRIHVEIGEEVLDHASIAVENERVAGLGQESSSSSEDDYDVQ